MTATKSPGARAARGASVVDRLGRRQVIPETNRQKQLLQVPIRATLIGSDRCEAEGVTAHGYAPVLDLCRELVAAGLNPAFRFEAWRGDTLCLRVRSIGEGARLTVEDNRHGTPNLRRWRDRPRRHGTGSPVAQNANGRGLATLRPAATRAMVAASNGGSQRRTARTADAQAPEWRHRHRIARGAAPADSLLGPKAPDPFGSRSSTEEVAADGVGCGP